MHTHEEIVGVRVGAANLEEFHEVVELTMDISANGHRAFDRLYVGLFLENLACLEMGESMSTAFPRCGRTRPLRVPRRGALTWEEKKSRWTKVMERNGPSRTASGRPPQRVVCRSSDSRSSRRGWGWWRARRWTTSALRERVRHPPCSYPSWRFEELRRRSEGVGIELVVVVGGEASRSNDVVALRARRGSLGSKLGRWAGGWWCVCVAELPQRDLQQRIDGAVGLFLPLSGGKMSRCCRNLQRV